MNIKNIFFSFLLFGNLIFNSCCGEQEINDGLPDAELGGIFYLSEEGGCVFVSDFFNAFRSVVGASLGGMKICKDEQLLEENGTAKLYFIKYRNSGRMEGCLCTCSYRINQFYLTIFDREKFEKMTGVSLRGIKGCGEIKGTLHDNFRFQHHSEKCGFREESD